MVGTVNPVDSGAGFDFEGGGVLREPPSSIDKEEEGVTCTVEGVGFDWVSSDSGGVFSVTPAGSSEVEGLGSLISPGDDGGLEDFNLGKHRLI